LVALQEPYELRHLPAEVILHCLDVPHSI
jgi:hypothetical protein